MAKYTVLVELFT